MKNKTIKKTFNFLILLCFTLVVINCSSDDNASSGSQSVPSITAIGSVASFGEISVLSQSVSKSIQISTSNLTDDLEVSVTANFEVSFNDIDFSSALTLDKDIANANDTTLYVRFSPLENSIGGITGNIKLESNQATEVQVSLVGIGLSITPIININGSINGFGDVEVLQNSLSQTIIVNGDNLVSDIALVISSDFEMSVDDITYSSSLQILEPAANENTLLYVRFAPSSVGVISGTLTLSNADTEDVVVNLAGNGTPMINNYVTFNQQGLANGGGYTRFLSQTFNLHSDLSNVEQIKMFVQIDCPDSGCDDWDRFANVKVKDSNTGLWFELGRYVTPYWVGTQQLERGLEFDVTDFKSLLTGATELRIFIENWTAKPDLITVEFDYIDGTPDYPYYAVSEILGYHGSSINAVPYGVDHTWDLEKQITVPANAESAHLRTTISGWGHAGPNDSDGRPCAEWCYRTHDVKINGANTFSHYLGPIGCASNPVSNQSPGNWQPDRAGWCPGMAVPTRVDDLGASMSGSTFTFEYDFEDWTNDMSNGDAYYATSAYVVVKSNSAITAATVIN